MVDALGRVAKFRGSDLRLAVARLEAAVARRERIGVGAFLTQESVTGELLRAAVLVKRAAAQIDSVVHAAGMIRDIFADLNKTDGHHPKQLPCCAPPSARPS